MTQDNIIKNAARKNYSESTPWPENDVWHNYTFHAEKTIVTDWLIKYSRQNMIILNAGSGGTQYDVNSKFIHLDIIEEYVSHFDNYIVGSVENIQLPDGSVDGIICVGSVLNYVDVQVALAEFSRILTPNGFIIIEFERSNSAEFLFTSEYGKYIFSKEYQYNGQTHPLWLYSEEHIRSLLKLNQMKIIEFKRIHTLSSIMYRLGLSEEKSAFFAKYDSLLKPLSYPFAHNALLLCEREFSLKCNNSNKS